MKLYSSKMKSYILLVFGCLIFAEQITELTADNSSSTDINSYDNVTTPVPLPTNTTTITTTTPVETTKPKSPTTIAPTTIAPTTVAPTTTMLPPSVSDPSTGSWTVYGVNGTNCIKLEAAIQFRITYERNHGDNVTAKLNVPVNATVKNYTCSDAAIILTFESNEFQIFFKNESGEIFAKNFTLQYYMDPKDFPDSRKNGTQVVSATNLTEFKVSAGKSFLCKVETKIDLGNVVISMQNLRVEAFRHTHDDNFSEATECSGDEKINDIVPIAVGCALAVLVIIVLIAYLVGRQRSRQQGYQSV